MDNQTKEAECCPKFNPAPWDNREFVWDNKRFIRDKVRTLFYLPLNFGAAMRRLMAKTDKAGATVPDGLCLSKHSSKWNMDIYLAVDREIPEAENITLSGKFFSRVYEGSFKDSGKWCQDFASYAQEKGFKIKEQYMWYTTCPKCAKKYGQNYVVIIGELE